MKITLHKDGDECRMTDGLTYCFNPDKCKASGKSVELVETILEINNKGVAIFLVEQNANMALSIADTGYVMETGRIVLTDKASALLQNEKVKKAYLGE